MNAMDERRRRAHEAYEAAYDWAYHGAPDGANNREEQLGAAIEVATQVMITPEIIHAALDAMTDEGNPAETMREQLAAAFRAAGFEVER